MREPKVYEDLTDLTVLKTAMETALNEYNLSPAVVPMQLVLFREAIEHSEHFLVLSLSPVSQLWSIFKEIGIPSPISPKSLPSQVREVTFLPAPDALMTVGGTFDSGVYQIWWRIKVELPSGLQALTNLFPYLLVLLLQFQVSQSLA